MLSVDDIENASVISSLPEKFSAVTTHFEQQNSIENKQLTDAIRSSVINAKNRATSQGISSTANAAKANLSYSSSTNQKLSNKNQKPLPQCEHCKGVHKTANCLKKQNNNMAEQLAALTKKIDALSGKAKFAVDDDEKESNEDTLSDFSDSMARYAVAYKASSSTTTVQWNVDSGTTNSLVPSNTQLENSKPSTLTLCTANNERITATHMGKVNVPGLPSVTAHHVNGLAEPLLSVSDITDNDIGVIFFKEKVTFVSKTSELASFINDNKSVISQGYRSKRSYYVDTPTVSSYCASQTASASLLTWHFRLGHLSLRSLQDLRCRKEIEVSVDDGQWVMECEDCMRGKFKRLNMKSRQLHRVPKKLDCVHSNLCQLPVKSRTGARYMMSFLDESTNFGMIYFLKSKDQATSCLQHYVKWAERNANGKLRKIRTNNGGEYTSDKWAE